MVVRKKKTLDRKSRLHILFLLSAVNKLDALGQIISLTSLASAFGERKGISDPSHLDHPMMLVLLYLTCNIQGDFAGCRRSAVLFVSAEF